MPLDLIKIVFISLTGVINIFLGFLVLVRNPKNLINKIFFLTGFLYGVWAFCLLFYEFPIFLSSYFWIKATYIVISLQQICVLSFSFIFPKPIFKKAWLFGALYSAFFLAVTTYLLFFTNTWILDVVVDSKKGLQTILGQGYIWWSLIIWVAVIWASINFIFSLRNSEKRNKAQVLYLFIGFTLFGIIATIVDIIIPFKYQDTRLFSVSTIASLIFTFTASYAIIKHRFLDIRFVAARSIAYSLLIIILGAFYAAGLFVTSMYFFHQETNLTSLTVSTLLALFMAFSFQPLRRFLENITDSFFFRGYYNSEQLLSQLSNIMSTNIELQSLCEDVLSSLTKEMKIARGGFVVLGDGLASIYGIIDLGFPTKLDLTYSQASSFFPFTETLVLDEMEENHLKNIMRQLDLSIAKTLMAKNQVIGLMLLGGKSSGEVYSDKDLKVLDILAPEVAVAIQNSQSYDKIKKFNIILSEEVKKATSELQVANTKLKQLDLLKDDFVSIASHELRTPMTAIRSYAWMALHRADMPLSPKLEKYLVRVLISTERLINLVNDMLNISRIESGKIEINPEPVDLILLTKDIIDEVYFSKSQEKKINFITLEKQIPKALADPEKLREVLLNLVGNSLKFTPHDGTITFDFFSDGTSVEISVKDTGVGISKEDLSKLFQKFSRLDNSYVGTASSGGTGLGLYISKNLVELMQGKIWVSSEGIGKGAVFTISLPIASRERLEHISQYTIRAEGGEAKPLEPVAI